MISNIEKLIVLLDAQIDKMLADGTRECDVLDSLCDERTKLEHQFLRSRINSDAHATSKMRMLARLAGSGERSDGADVYALNQIADWMTKRFQRHEEFDAKAA